ncbi:DUF6089 family protein [Thermaurantimonas aggregans]|uniref:DUF6089 family protein n=1 Tax=Thermaurantimonas aggregans TaxID=2173829 RepID=UPI0023F0C037|nr:DUF6089 family protein [Thermaurantimonas aggregans]MCX8148828.1 DUF6089 family protein [Thermaurantimonas aggregans]
MRFKNILFVYWPIVPTLLVGQKTKYWEWGAGAGLYHYQGDLNENFSVGIFFNEAGPRLTGFVRNNPVPWFSYGIETSYGNCIVKDTDYGRTERNWNVYSESFDINLSLEWNFLRYGKWHWENKLAPYFKVGAGALVVSSRGQNTVNLPESIELHPYTYGSYNIFYGYGVKTRVGYRTSLFLQFTRHYTGTDKMDGFIDNSIQTPKNDQYISIILGISKLVF